MQKSFICLYFSYAAPSNYIGLINEGQHENTSAINLALWKMLRLTCLNVCFNYNKQKAIASLKYPYVNASQNFLNKGQCIRVYAKHKICFNHNHDAHTAPLNLSVIIPQVVVEKRRVPVHNGGQIVSGPAKIGHVG